MSDSDEIREISWCVHPAGVRPLAAAIAALVVSLLAAAAAFLMGHWAWFLLSVLILVVGLKRFFFVSEHRVTAAGIAVRNPFVWQELRWSEVRRFVYDSRGGLLSRRAKASVLDAFAGVQILFGEDRERVIALINSYVQSQREGNGEIGAAIPSEQELDEQEPGDQEEAG